MNIFIYVLTPLNVFEILGRFLVHPRVRRKDVGKKRRKAVIEDDEVLYVDQLLKDEILKDTFGTQTQG